MTIVRVRDGRVRLGRFGGARVRLDGPALDAPTEIGVDTVHAADPETGDLTAAVALGILAPVEGATSYQFFIEGVGAWTVAADADPLAISATVPVVEGPTVRNARVQAVGPNGPGAALMFRFTQAPGADDGDETDPEDVEPIEIVAAPAVTFNGGYVEGAEVTAAPPGFTGGPLTEPMTVQYLITDAEGLIEYDGDEIDHAAETFTALVDFSLPAIAPSEWIGERFAIRYELKGLAGTVVVWTTLSDVITSDAPEVIPPALGPDDWETGARQANDPNSLTHHVRQYRILRPGLTPYAVQWLNTNIDNFEDPSSYEGFWNPCLLYDDGWWDHRTLEGDADREFPNGTSAHNLRIRYKMTETGPWSPTSTDNKTVTYLGPPAPPPDQGWSHIPFREPEELAAKLAGGGMEQWWHKAWRSKSDPSLIVACQDTGGTWFSEDDGITWRKSQDSGLLAYFSVSVAVDPGDREVWLYAGGNAGFVEASGDFNGIFRSVDRGRSWALVNNFSSRGTPVGFRRTCCTAFAFDETVAATPTTRTVYAVIPITDARGNMPGYIRAEIWRSNTGGQTWFKVRDLSTSGFGRFNTLKHHPTQSGRLFMATDNGLWETTDGCANWTKRNVAGAGNYSIISIEINPGDPDEIYTCITAHGSSAASPIGVYRSTTSGTSWTSVSTPAGFPCSQIAIGNQNGGGWGAAGSRTIYLVGRSPGNHMARVSHNGGGSWFNPVCNRKPGKMGEAGSISEPASSNSNSFRPTQILPHPTAQGVCFVHSRAKCYRTTDRGQIFNYSGEGFEGQQWSSGFCGISFCEATQDDAWKHFIVGVTDTGWFGTSDGGITWHFCKPQALDPAGGVNAQGQPNRLKNSCNGVAICPDEPQKRAFTAGHITLSPTHIYRTLVAEPGNEASGDISRINGSRPPQHPSFLHWHKSKPSRLYFQSYRFTGANGVGAPTPQSYGAGFAGRVCAVWPGNNDFLISANGQTLIWSQDEGSSWATFVNVGWNPFMNDNRYPMVAWHPSDSQIIFTISAGKDLARYNRTAGVWKTDYNLLGRIRADHPQIGGMLLRMKSVAIDPQDANVGAVTFETPSYSVCYRSTNIQSNSPSWEDVTYNAPRLNGGVLAYHPFTGDLFRGFNAHGGCYVLPPPAGAVRPKPSIAGNFIIP